MVCCEWKNDGERSELKAQWVIMLIRYVNVCYVLVYNVILILSKCYFAEFSDQPEAMLQNIDIVLPTVFSHVSH